MKEKDVKRAYDLAQNEIEEQKNKEHEKQVAEVKEIVKRTLLEIEKLQDKKGNIDEKLKILKLDIEDLKAGKLERIKERQDKDPKAKEISIIIIKEKETIREREVPVPSPWYQPYIIQWNYKTYPVDNTIYCDGSGYNTNLTYTTSNNAVMNFCTSDVDSQIKADINSVNCHYSTSVPKTLAVFTLNNSVVKDNVIGTYKLAKKVINLR